MTELTYLDKTRLASTLGDDSREKHIRFYELYAKQLKEFSELLASVQLPRDASTLAEYAHKYKSSSRVMGADLLAERLERLELMLAAKSDSGLPELAELIRILDATKELVLKEISRKHE